MAFAYIVPQSLEEAMRLSRDYGPEAVAKMGGCTVMVAVRRGLLRPKVVIGLHRLPGLDSLRVTDGGLLVGAGVTLRALERSTEVASALPVLWRTVRTVASPLVRNMATLVGNVTSALPDSDLVPLLTVLEATLTVRGPEGERSLPVGEVARAPYRHALAPGELATAIAIPAPPPGLRLAYVRFAPREAFDRPLAAAAVALRLADGVCQEARVALVGAGPLPARSGAAEAALQGQPLTPEALARASEAAMESAAPPSDYRASADYRRHLVGVVLRRALGEALAS